MVGLRLVLDALGVGVVVAVVPHGGAGDDGLVVVVVALGGRRPCVVEAVADQVVVVALEGGHVERDVNVARHWNGRKTQLALCIKMLQILLYCSILRSRGSSLALDQFLMSRLC